MNKSKLCSFAIAGMIGFVGISPLNNFAAVTNAESRSETNKDQNERKSDFREKMKKASEKWKTLTEDQKQEVYVLVENEMKVENKILDKLVEFGVMEQEDASIIQNSMIEKFNRVKESGEFPLFRQKDSRNKK